MTPPRALVVHRRSTFAEMEADRRHERFLDLVGDNDPLVEPIVKAHEAHMGAMEAVRRELEARSLAATWCHDMAGVRPEDYDLVITVGGDGTVLHASHDIGETPVLAVNSSPLTSVGYFTAGGPDEIGEILDAWLAGDLRGTKLFRMEVRVNGRILSDRVLNDVLFSHDCPASTSRYVLSVDGESEAQLSSGVWIATAAGSTAALRAAGGTAMRAGSRRLQYVVREPRPGGETGRPRPPRLVRGFVGRDEVLTIRSKIAAARLWVDGPHVVFPVDFGDVVTFSGSAPSLELLGYRARSGAPGWERERGRPGARTGRDGDGRDDRRDDRQQDGRQPLSRE